MSESAGICSDDGSLVAGAGPVSATGLFPVSAGGDVVPESEALAASSAVSLEPESGAEAPESALAELVSAEYALWVSVVFESVLVESEELGSLLSAEDESEEPESLLSAVDEAESAEPSAVESTVSESEESEDWASEEPASELLSELSAEELSELSAESAEEELSEELSELSEEELSEELSELSELSAEELSELLSELSEVLTEAGSAADARVGAAMTMTTSTSPHSAAARTAILRALGSSRARSVVPMPVTSRRASSKRGTVSLTVLQFQPRGVSR
jgi:hypothetical protein